MSSLPFARRHIGPSPAETAMMLETVGFPTLDALIEATVPADIRHSRPLDLPSAASEAEALAELKSLMSRNQVFRSFIGQGYYGTFTPPVIQRCILENPGWYTAYTPYQAEISQGRLEALLNFQTMIRDLTALDVANASLLDEATAAAEAVTLCHGAALNGQGRAVFVDNSVFPQTLAVIRTRMDAIGISVVTGPWREAAFSAEESVFAAVVQFPAGDGSICDYREFIERAHAAGAKVIVAADLLALTLFTPPGEIGADVCVGSAQRFGVPLGFGGPHAGFMAVKDELKRRLPGRLIGVSIDSHGQPALRLSLQTREQHIRRDKATSNICTAQVLLAVMASMYAVYHGSEGLRTIAQRVHTLTSTLRDALAADGLEIANPSHFDTLTVRVPGQADAVHAAARAAGCNFRSIGPNAVGLSLDETTTASDLETLLDIFAAALPDFRRPPTSDRRPPTADRRPPTADRRPPTADRRPPTAPFLTHPVFKRYHTEHELLRYLARLEKRDIALNESMIPLGSCTMKLNAAAEMMPLSWPEVSELHPFAPLDQAQGYLRVFEQLEKWLCEITGFAAVSLQPNAGSQGEYAGLLAIREYHKSRGDDQRTSCLIPVSAHGTNPASAVMAGFTVVPVKCDASGNIDVNDLKRQAEAHVHTLGALMVTYPSTHGVFETTIRDVCQLIHELGGQVYMDGANMNAQVGLTNPALIGADVCHLNLHKTFCIPHGGGGPGVGPIGVARHLAPFLPARITLDEAQNIPGPVSAAPWGSASITSISWMYIRLMGGNGLTEATRYAILNANYVAKRLAPCFPTLYTGAAGTVAHECILDVRSFKDSAGIGVEDIAKRLIDYGYHAPTMSWPVPGTLMVEPTESESKAELDRFCEAMMSIHAEIRAIESGAADRADNPLKHAPHTALAVTADHWPHAYSRQSAAFPAPWLHSHKYWPPVGRVDNVHGDKNLVCTCEGMEAYQ
ncbi:MAG: aminomethyl-transferring glycine dehydrogenase [Verrucomicrobiales bacterium]